MKRGGPKQGHKAVIALMRKLARGLWHCVHHQVAFDARALFDASRLQIKPITLQEAK